MKKVFFLGAGRMAGAIAGGMVRKNYRAEDIVAYDILPAAAEKFTATTGIVCHTANLNELIAAADVVVFAVKPQFLAGAIHQSLPVLRNKLIVSIVAGVSMAKLHELSDSRRIVRVMPNTPALVGKGCTGFALSEEVSSEEAAWVAAMLDSVGISFKLEERLLDAVTALSGSGPAYVFEFLESLVEGGAACGLGRELAQKMALETIAGSVEMLRQTGLHPGVLKDQVTSPGGTTMRALEVLETRNFRGIVSEAIAAADARSKELGRNA